MAEVTGRTLTGCNIFRSLAVALVFCLAIGVGGSGDGYASLLQSAHAAESDGTAQNVDVFFVTNRQREPGDATAESYGGGRGELHVGRCRVEFTPIRILDEVASRVPFYVPSEKKKLMILDREEPAAFWGRLFSSVNKSASQSIVMYVHGYSNSFTRTCRMAARMQRALKGQATVLMFSWPSNGRPTDYVSDQADLEWSVPLLADLLAEITERVGASRTQLLAHSLGSRGVIFALQRLSADSDRRPLIGRLVFLAPDFDAQTFVELLPRLEPLADNITLYASSNDTPLRVSQELNEYPRLGQAGENLTVAKGIETIDVSPAGLYQILGHEYFHFHPQVSADLARLITTGKSAAERPGLRPRERNGVNYWEILPADTGQRP